MGNPAQPVLPAMVTTFQLLHQRALKRWTGWIDPEQRLTDVTVISDCCCEWIAPPCVDELMQHSSCQAWHIDRQHEKRISRIRRENMRQRLERTVPRSRFGEQPDPHDTAQADLMSGSTAHHNDRQIHGQQPLDQGCEPNTTAWTGQQSLVATHATTSSTTENTGSKLKQSNQISRNQP